MPPTIFASPSEPRPCDDHQPDFEQIDSSPPSSASRPCARRVSGRRGTEEAPRDRQLLPRPRRDDMGHVDNGKSRCSTTSEANVVASRRAYHPAHRWRTTSVRRCRNTPSSTRGSRGVHSDACRGARSRHRDPVRRRTTRHAADSRGDLPRQDRCVAMIVAINKVDCRRRTWPGNPELAARRRLEVRRQLLFRRVSASGDRRARLLDSLLLQAITRLRPTPTSAPRRCASPARPVEWTRATVLVLNGTVRVATTSFVASTRPRPRSTRQRGQPCQGRRPFRTVQCSHDRDADGRVSSSRRERPSAQIAQRRERARPRAKSLRTAKGGVLETSVADFRREMRSPSSSLRRTRAGRRRRSPRVSQLSTSSPSDVIQRASARFRERPPPREGRRAVIIAPRRPDNKARAAAEREVVDIKL